MATLEQVFQQERAWIAACVDVDALVDKIGDFRDSARTAERDGQQLLRMRAGDLIELAQQRVVWLKAREMRAEKARQAASAPKVEAKMDAGREARAPERVRGAATPTRERAAPTMEAAPQSGTTEHNAREAIAVVAAEKAKADARLAVAEAARIELQNEVLRAQLEAARRMTATPPATAMVKASTPAGVVPSKVVAATSGPARKVSTTTASAARQPAPVRTPSGRAKPASILFNEADGYSEADRLALASVGRWPPTPAGHRSAFWSKYDDWPPEWTLTGGDLGRFRGEINLTRAVFAAQLGVPSLAVKEAELKPRERVGPALQIAVQRAMDHQAEVRRRRREHRAAERAPEEPVAATVPSVSAPIVVVPAASAAPRVFTGADLAGLRAARQLSQREMADLLGVEQGTISKGEGKAGAALGPALQEALGRLGAGGTPQIPE